MLRAAAKFIDFSSMKRLARKMVRYNANSSIFWDITPYNKPEINRHFGGTCHLYLQGRRLGQVRHQPEAELCSENGSDMFLRNVG
jgi:hypothetical protein